jgi:hypothetical protein
VATNRWLSVYPDQHMTTTLGIVNCDPAFSVMVFYFGRVETRDATLAMRHMVESVDCAVTEANRVRPIAATRLPAKFGRTPETAMQMYQALDGETLVVNFTRSDVQRDQVAFRQIMRAMVGQSMGEDIPDSRIFMLDRQEPRPPGKSSLLRFEVKSLPQPDMTLITIWAGSESSDQLARERQTQVGCPGSESTPTPAFEVLAEEACGAGRSEFCGLKQLSD